MSFDESCDADYVECGGQSEALRGATTGETTKELRSR
jgi:hypothetical protein